MTAHDDARQIPGHLTQRGLSCDQAPLGGDQVADRVDVNEGLHPAGHGLRGDEDVAGQGQQVAAGGADQRATEEVR